jgi:glyoxylate/hydroxypyruvate reductase A
MKTLVHVRNEDPTPWIDGIRRWLPDLDVIRLTDDALPGEVDPGDVDIAVSWRMPHGIYAQLPNLKLIQSMAAGVDHILSEPNRPTHVPIARLVDPWMGRSMTHHVVGHILRWHRDADRFEAERATQNWPTGIIFDPDATNIGILGMGHLGQAVARSLMALGFPVIGWSRSAKSVDGVEVLNGADGLDQVARRANALVCLLPLTEETRGLIDAELLAKLPAGALVVNVGRGGHVVDEDLLAALDTGTLKAAALDVFQQEPLPKGHPFWSHERIWPTPHIAAEINLPTACRAFAENIKRVRANETPDGLIDPEKGY